MTELVRRTVGEINPEEVARISTSKLVPEHIAKDAASVEYMMRIGAALGIDPTSAFQHIYVFPDGKGRLKAGMSAHLMHALAIAAGHTLHVEGDALKATAVLVRNTSADDLHRFRAMREEERSRKVNLLDDVDRVYRMQRQQILDQIDDLKALAEIGEESVDEEIAKLRQQVLELRKKYNFDDLRDQVTHTNFDLSKLARFESVWTMARARNIPNLTDKGTWQSYGPEMLKSRAKASVVRDGAIEVILGVRRIMSDLGITFSEDVDDRLAVQNVLYTPDELGADVNEEGAPLQGRVINVTVPGASKTQDNLVRAAAKLISDKSAEKLGAWVDAVVRHPEISAEDKISRLDAIAKAVEDANRADEMVSQGDESCTLAAHLEGTIQSLR